MTRPQRYQVSWAARTADRGASLVEYAFLIALIAIACIVALRYMGTETEERYSDIGNSIEAAPN